MRCERGGPKEWENINWIKKVLIVDDSLHTGATIDVATPYLISSGVVEIRVASIAYVANRKPDFFVLPRGNYSFPWSKD